MLALYLGIGFMCIACAGIMWCCCIIASETDDYMEKQYKKVQSYDEFFNTGYICRGENNK